jgi:hypothetical protein
MQRFDPENPLQAQVNADILFDQALGTPPTSHQAYLCCATTRRGPRIFCLHAPSRFHSALDGRVILWDNNSYAFLGDVTDEVATTVVFPPNAFIIVPAVTTYDAAHIMANIHTLNGFDVLPAVPKKVEVTNTAPTTTRYMMYLPSRYTILFMDA